MEKDNLLYTIRNWYENKGGTGIMLTLTAKDGNGAYHSIKAYVSYRSNYENSPKAEKINRINSRGKCARITVFNEKMFDGSDDTEF